MAWIVSAVVGAVGLSTAVAGAAVIGSAIIGISKIR